MDRDQVRQAVWDMLTQSGAHHDFGIAVKALFGWEISDAASVSRVSQWLNPRNPHQLPAAVLPLAIRVTGLDYVSPILLRAGLRRMRPVRHAAAKGRARSG